MSDHDKIYSTKFQDSIERSTLLMFVLTAIAVAVGGIVEIVPLFYLPNTGMCQGDATCNNTQHKDLQGNTIPMDKIVWNPVTSAHKTLADWQPGDDVIVPPPGSCGTAKERMEKPDPDAYALDWFMTFKKLPLEKLNLPPAAHN